METSTAERHAGMNVSYENSFNAIKKDILRETVDKKRIAALTKEVIPIEEKPNKPKEKLLVKNMAHHHHGPKESLNLTQEVRNPIQLTVSNTPTITAEEMLNRTAAQYASQRSGGNQGSMHQANNQFSSTVEQPFSNGAELFLDFANNTLNDSILKNNLRSSVVVDKPSHHHGANSLMQTYAHQGILSDRPKTSL